MRVTKVTFNVIVLLAMSVCTSVAASSGKTIMDSFDAMTANPTELFFAFGLDEVAALRNGDATLSLSFTPEGSSEPAVDERFALTLIGPESLAQTPRSLAGETIFFTSLASNDIERMKTAQKQLLEFRKNRILGDGSFSFGVFGSCRKTQTLPDHLPYRSFFRTSKTDTFVEVLERTDLLELLGKEKRSTFLSQMALCG